MSGIGGPQDGLDMKDFHAMTNSCSAWDKSFKTAAHKNKQEAAGQYKCLFSFWSLRLNAKVSKVQECF